MYSETYSFDVGLLEDLSVFQAPQKTNSLGELFLLVLVDGADSAHAA